VPLLEVIVKLLTCMELVLVESAYSGGEIRVEAANMNTSEAV
jgi:hypothetical protein